MNKAMNTLPSNYIPYPKLVICNNELINCKVFIDHNGFYPLLIGKGTMPKIWINNKYTKYYPDTKPIVSENISSDNRIKVLYNNIKKTLTIKFLKYKGIKDDIILNINYENNSAIVNVLDLRPLGYKIYGDNEGMYAGETYYTGNIFNNIDSMFKIGE